MQCGWEKRRLHIKLRSEPYVVYFISYRIRKGNKISQSSYNIYRYSLQISGSIDFKVFIWLAFRGNRSKSPREMIQISLHSREVFFFFLIWCITFCSIQGIRIKLYSMPWHFGRQFKLSAKKEQCISLFLMDLL